MDQDATVAQYQAMQEILGTRRAVVVQPRPYGTDNAVTLRAIRELGSQWTRGVAVVRADVSDTELDALHQGGVRGVRLSLFRPEGAAVSFEMTAPIAARVQRLGWHLQLHWTADQIARHAELLLALPTPIVFDHMARLPTKDAKKHPAYAVLQELIQRGRTWIKLSGAYLCSTRSTLDDYGDVGELAHTWLDLAPTRLVWGSDWPHTTERPAQPNTLALLEQLFHWTDSASLRQQILVDNPSTLYDFEAT
jgi:D-galactarolactone isomerase